VALKLWTAWPVPAVSWGVLTAFERLASAGLRSFVVRDEIWLGRRDSNPNNRVQSAVSYR
jgi:hypothetical protein